VRSNAWTRACRRIVTRKSSKVFGWSLLALACLPIHSASARQVLGLTSTTPSVWVDSLSPGQTTRIADPKLNGGGVEIGFGLAPVGVSLQVVVELCQNDQPILTIFNGPLPGSVTPHVISWDGRDGSGNYVDPGDYQIRVRLGSGPPDQLLYPLSIVRLGITEIEAKPSLGNDEWQMVYFLKQGAYTFFATPAIHEYLSVREIGELSDLDLDDGQPRPAPVPHLATDEPQIEGSYYEDDQYNYPLCYLMGREPVFEVTYGQSATSSSGGAVGVGYPVPGYEIRPRAQDGAGAWTSSATSITPGGVATFVGPALPSEATRLDRTVVWSWQYRQLGETAWTDLAGSFQTSHRFYTVIATPQFAAGASGTQYTGPWVEVADYVYLWKEALGIQVIDESSLVEALFRGFIGQQGTLTTAIEGVIYDAYPVGGDGGATHYYQFGTHNMRLSRLLDFHSRGVYVNCSDCAGATSPMSGMLGVLNVKMLRLGTMNLKAIWGIGCPDYTLNLWGSGSHGFSYHHIVTRTEGVTVCDACLALDVDGSPGTLPGVPGWNHDRPWVGTLGYDYLSSYNNVSRTVESMPRMN